MSGGTTGISQDFERVFFRSPDLPNLLKRIEFFAKRKRRVYAKIFCGPIEHRAESYSRQHASIIVQC
jgi:hypothetical protein